MTQYDLVTQPWIPVITTAGVTKRVSLADLLTTDTAQRVTAIGGDPPVAVALLRFCLAILHDALGGPADDDEWMQWWDADQWPTGDVAAYLDTHRHRFDLFGDEPLGQDVRLSERPRKTVAELLPHRASGDNAVLWSHNTSPPGEAPLRLSAADAACWLLAEHQFSRSGIFPTVAGGKTSAAQPPLTNRTVTYPVGDSLAETLLLNLTVYRPHYRDVPPWRRDTPVIAGPPAGLVSLLTWQTRNLLLDAERQPDGTITVSECVRAADDRVDCSVDVATLEVLDPHLSFRTTGTGQRVAVVYDPSVSPWRLAPALLGSGGGSARSALATTLRRAREHDLDLRRVRVETAGLAMASFAKPVDWVRAQVPVSLGADITPHMAQATGYAAAAAKALSAAARDMLGGLGVRQSGRGNPEVAADLADKLWASLDRPGHTLLGDLATAGGPADDPAGTSGGDRVDRLRRALLDGWRLRVATHAHGLLHDTAAAFPGPAAVRALADAHTALRRALAALPTDSAAESVAEPAEETR